MRAMPKGQTFGLCLYILCWYNVHVLYCIPGTPNAYYMLLYDLTNEKPEVTLCDVTAFNKSMNNCCLSRLCKRLKKKELRSLYNIHYILFIKQRVNNNREFSFLRGW